MQKLRTKAACIFLTPLSISREILEVRKIRVKKKQTLHQEMTFKNSYYLDMTEVSKKAQALANESLTFRIKFNVEKH